MYHIYMYTYTCTHKPPYLFRKLGSDGRERVGVRRGKLSAMADEVWFDVNVTFQELDEGLSRENRVPGQQLVTDRSQRVEIGPGIH